MAASTTSAPHRPAWASIRTADPWGPGQARLARSPQSHRHLRTSNSSSHHRSSRHHSSRRHFSHRRISRRISSRRRRHRTHPSPSFLRDPARLREWAALRRPPARHRLPLPRPLGPPQGQAPPRPRRPLSPQRPQGRPHPRRRAAGSPPPHLRPGARRLHLQGAQAPVLSRAQDPEAQKAAKCQAGRSPAAARA